MVDDKAIMIIESIGNIFLTLIRSLLFSWSCLITIIIPLLMSTGVIIYYWPLISVHWKRMKQVNGLPGPKCTSLIMGNIPYEVVWNSMLNSADYKSMIISKSLFINDYASNKINRVCMYSILIHQSNNYC